MRRSFGALFVLVMLAGCTTPEVSAGGDPTSDVVEGATDARTGSSEFKATETTQPAPSEQPAAPHRSNIEVSDYGYSTFTAYDDSTRAAWGVVLTNPNDDYHLAASIDVTVALLDGNGSVLASTSDSVALILPGHSAAVTGSTMNDVEGVEEMRVQARARSWDEQEGPFPALATSDVNVRDGNIGKTVTGAVASTFSEDLSDVYATAILRDGTDAIIGGGFTFIDFIPAASDTTFEITVDDVDGIASADVYMSLSNLTLAAM